MFGRKKKSGHVYIAESTRKDGSKKYYVGQTSRSPYKRAGEHISSIKSKNSNSWVGKGTNVRLVGSVKTSNRFKAERTVKKMSPSQKRALGREGARKYKKKYW